MHSPIGYPSGPQTCRVPSRNASFTLAIPAWRARPYLCYGARACDAFPHIYLQFVFVPYRQVGVPYTPMCAI